MTQEEISNENWREKRGHESRVIMLSLGYPLGCYTTLLEPAEAPVIQVNSAA
jgi:hypothetical protein